LRQIAPISVPSVESIKQRRDLLGTKGELERIQHKLERAERALESLSRILTLIPDPIEIVTSDYTILFANRASRLLHDDERLEGSFYFQSVMGLEEPPPESLIILISSPTTAGSSKLGAGSPGSGTRVSAPGSSAAAASCA